MKKSLFFRLSLLSVLGALTLSLISVFCLVRISDMVVEDYRYGYLLYIARSIEKTSEEKPIALINMSKVEAPPVSKNKNVSLMEIAEFGSATHDQPHTKPSLWLVSENGEVISTNTEKKFPSKWTVLPHPKKVHGIEAHENFLLDPKTFVVKLDTTPVTYLVSRNEKTLFQGPFLWIQGMHTFTTAAFAVLIALSICFWYLRKKSTEARKVLAQLEAGDLKARFDVKRVDEVGSLILDFNRMAEQIERLVNRLSVTEASRSNLLQELGHDLRTPLTSLTTSFETLKYHSDKISTSDRDELFEMMGSDIRYFKDLLEKLTIVATIEGPKYKASTETIDVQEILESEIRNRQVASGHLNWRLQLDDKNHSMMAGDQHLITRLFKNAFDNASRYASHMVKVSVNSTKDRIEVFVMDDGPGLSHEAIESFGKRRERRHVKERDAHDFSLGLGSVIMKTIAEAHDGSIQMSNLSTHGACLKVTFKRY